jgi:nitrogen fixation protein NifT
MPMIIFRLKDDALYGYIAKQDREVRVTALEFNEEQCWGGQLQLEDGDSYYIAQQPKPLFPISLRATRAAS